MSRIMFVFTIFLTALLLSCATDPADNDPMLDIYASGVSMSAIGAFTVSLYSMENIGHGDADHVSVELHIYGSTQSEIAYSLDDYSPVPYYIYAGSTYNDSYYSGHNFVFVPWYFRIIINYKDIDDNSMEPIEIYQQFTVF